MGTAKGCASGRSAMRCGTAIDSMPSCTTPIFSKIPATSQDTQPAAVVICQAKGTAIANTATSKAWACHNQMPTPAVPTSSMALSSHSAAMNWVVMREWPAMASWCACITPRTWRSSSLGRAKSLTVRMLA